MTQGPENVPPARPAQPNFLPPQEATPPPAAPLPPIPPAAPPPPRASRKQRRTFLIVLGVFAVAAIAVGAAAVADISSRTAKVGEIRRSAEKPLITSFPANPCEVVPAATIGRLVPSAETIPSTQAGTDPRAGCRWLGRASGASSRHVTLQMTAYQDDTVASGADTAKRELAGHRTLQQKRVPLQPLPGVGPEAFAGHSTANDGTGESGRVLVMFRTGNTLVDLSFSASDDKDGRRVAPDQSRTLQDATTIAREIAQYLTTCATCGG
ncbi:hypothetical protein [Actinomadura rugatobispora]|uniref:DUF3558 domain-containing protein n=1 Tax=Actinomadura rugatobispora TaxID=1994 RepID=A0ABW0ZRV2_9ACTN|nr:hypothetical protein GCM10010200_050560 [Actinomadura rugatobispora]